MKKYNIAMFLITAMLALILGAPVILAADTSGTTTATPWYLSADLIAAVIALATSALAIWQNKEKRTAQKVSETLVVAIEQASRIPAVAEKENELKAKIKEVTTKAGVEPVVNKLVKLLT
jgi:hypothetical protein